MKKPDPNWKPEPGRLIVRIMTAPWIHEVAFEYLEIPNGRNARTYQNIARIRNWIAGPEFGGYIECTGGNMDETGSGAYVVRRYAHQDDLFALRRLWGKDSRSFPEWLKSVLSDDFSPGLSSDSKTLLLKLMPIDIEQKE